MYMYLLLWCFCIVKNVKIGFLFGVNACVFIPMILFMVKIFKKLLKIGIQGNG